MRFYKLTINDEVVADTTGNPYELHIEFNINLLGGSRVNGDSITLFNPPTELMVGVENLVGQRIILDGGYSLGLPFANEAAPFAGTLVDAYIWSAYPVINGSDRRLVMTLYSGKPPSSDGDKPSGVVFQVKSGEMLLDQINYVVTSQNLKLDSSGIDQTAFVAKTHISMRVTMLADLLLFLETEYKLSASISGGVVTLIDGNAVDLSAPLRIGYPNVIGQPISIDVSQVAVNVMMRGDIRWLQKIELVAYVDSSGAFSAVAGAVQLPMTNVGEYTVIGIRHIGSYKNNDQAAWMTQLTVVRL